MAILFVYVIGTFLLWVLVQTLSPHLKTIDLDFRSLPVPLNAFVGIGVGLLIFANFLAWLAAIAVVAIHSIWVFTGEWSLSSSVRTTWRELRRDEFFEEEKPTRLRANRTAVQQTSPQSKSGVVIEQKGDRGRLYRDLNHNKGEIRLLKPTKSEQGKLCFELEHQALNDDTRRYTALSYCWGDGEPTEVILVKSSSAVNGDSVRVKIRRNLYNALARMRSENKYTDEVLWIDALCINQENQEERNEQVKRMRSIFTTARKVVSWVPEEGTYAHDSSQANGSASGSLTSDRGHNQEANTDKLFDNVFNNEYWSRLWIVQEFALAQEIEILTSSDNIDEDRLDILRKAAIARNDPRRFERVSNVLEIREGQKSEEWPSLLELLIRTSANMTDNVHDRVFGVLSLSRDDQSFLAEPSYGRKPEELAMVMTRRYLGFKNSYLDIILLGPQISVGPPVPSWCPRYYNFDSLPNDRRLFEYVQEVFDRGKSPQTQLFSATGRSICKVHFKDYSILCCPAFPLGTITSLGWVSSDTTRNEYPTSPENYQTSFDPAGSEVATAFWNLLTTLIDRDRPILNTIRNDTAANGIETSSGVRTDGKECGADDYKRCKYPYVYFMLLVFGGGGMHVDEADPGASDGWYAQWLSTNQRFMFGKQTLHENAKTMGSLLKSLSFWKWTDSVMDMLRASTRHKEIKDWKRIHRPLKEIAKQNMRLMTLMNGGTGIMGLAHAAAKEDDEVFLLSGCSVPVILRKSTDRTQYSIVGDAIVPGVMYGEKWKGPTTDVEII